MKNKSTLIAILVLAVPIAVAVYVNRKNMKSKGPDIGVGNI